MSRPRAQPDPPPPAEPTHVIIPLAAFERLLNHLENLPWKTADPILAHLRATTLPFAEDSSPVLPDE